MMPWTTYKEKLKSLSLKLVEAQKPIRILNSIKLTSQVEDELARGKYKVMPKLNAEFYSQLPIGFEIVAKREEIKALKNEIVRELGASDELGLLLNKVADQYLMVVEMLSGRGTKKFYEMSRQLYGSPKDTFIEDKNKIVDMAHMLYEILSGVDSSLPQTDFIENLSAEEVVKQLSERFLKYFGEGGVEARLADGIVADAAAGGDVVKIREGATFAQREVEIYEVHEGWVHVGTTLNGRAQPVAKFLSIGPPRCTSTQEGLAIIMEIFTFRSYPKRARQINDRIVAIDKVEDGANLLEIIEYFRTEGYSERDAVVNSLRVFRGGMVEGGAPFTKDISYCKGFVENYNFFRTAIRAGRPEVIPFIFSGKLHVDDVPLLYSKYKEGIIQFPTYLPYHFRDLHGLAVWMSFSSFFNRVDLKSVQSHYDKLLSRA